MAAKDDTYFQKYLFWFVCNDATFMKRYSGWVHPQQWENAEEVWLLETATDFYKRYNRCITEEAVTLLLTDKEDNPKFDKEIVAELYDAVRPDDESYDFLLDYAGDYFKRRLSLAIVAEYADTISQGEFDEARDVLAKGLMDLSRSQEADTVVSGIRDLDGALAKFGEVHQVGGMSTGLDHLDYYMTGGLKPAGLGVILGTAGGGKSQFLTYLARQAFLRNNNVLFASLEMPEGRVLERFSRIRPW